MQKLVDYFKNKEVISYFLSILLLTTVSLVVGSTNKEYYLFFSCISFSFLLFLYKSKKTYTNQIMVVQLLLFVFYHIIAYFNIDDFEHIHSSFLVSQGLLPYRDFFQHHHPLYWYLLSPIIQLFGTSLNTFLLIKAFNACIGLLIFFGIYKCCKALNLKEYYCKLSVLFSLSLTLLIKCYTEVRPDVPEVACSIFAFYYYLRLFNKPNDKKSLKIGVLIGLSFIFLQKAAIFIALMFLLSTYDLYKKRIKVKHYLIIWSIAFVLFLALNLYFYSFGLDTYKDFILLAWVINFTSSYRLEIWPLLDDSRLVHYNLLFILIGVSSFFFILSQHKFSNIHKVIVLFAVVFTLSLFAYKQPLHQYYTRILPFWILSIVIFLEKGNIIINNKGMLFLLFLMPCIVYTFGSPTNINQKKIFRYVMNHSKVDDVVMDTFTTGVTFRQNGHYFWFGYYMNGWLDTYRNALKEEKFRPLVTNDKSEGFEDIIFTKPKIVILTQSKYKYHFDPYKNAAWFKENYCRKKMITLKKTKIHPLTDSCTTKSLLNKNGPIIY